MNLNELIVWVFSLIVASAAAVHGYKLFGVFGLIVGVVLGVIVGLLVGTSVIRLVSLFVFSKRNRRSHNK